MTNVSKQVWTFQLTVVGIRENKLDLFPKPASKQLSSATDANKQIWYC